MQWFDKVLAVGNLLTCFELVFSLKVNLAKSVLVLVVEASNIGDLAEVLGCEVGSLPIPYLGLPLGSCFKDEASWNGVVERSIRILSNWKRMYLSKGGQITLEDVSFQGGSNHPHKEHFI